MSSEKTIETYLKKQVEKLGGIAYKFTSPARKNVPDRLCVIKNVMPYFVECKETGEKPRPGQLRELRRLKKLNQRVFVVDTKRKVDAIIFLMIAEMERRSHE